LASRLRQNSNSHSNVSVHLTPPVELILTNFQPTGEIRGVILMPGAADRLYFYDWGQAALPQNPTLLDAITALTNKADLQIFVAPPFLLIARSYDDPRNPLSFAPNARVINSNSTNANFQAALISWIGRTIGWFRKLQS
jgi:hypothetical protein